jgi:phage-related protein
MISINNDAVSIERIPNIFEDFLGSFKTIFSEVKSKLTEVQEKYERGLERLNVAKDSVEGFQTYLDTK